MKRALPLLVAFLALAPAAHAAEPDIVFTAEPPELGASNDVTFAYTAGDSATFTCRLDDTEFPDCRSPRVYMDLADGAHVFTLRATDPTGTAEAIKRFTIDTVAPAAPVITTPAQDSAQNSKMVTLSGSAEPGADVVVSEGADARGTAMADAGGAWTVAIAGVPEGVHEYTATATDAVEHTSAPSEGRRVRVDLTPPAAPEVSGDPNGFTLSAEAGAALACSLDAGAFEACASGVSYPGLGDGEHLLSVRATDAAGNASAATEHRFTVTHTPAATPTPEPTATPTRTLIATPVATPVYRKTVVLRPQAGRTLVRRPGETAFAEIRSRTAVVIGTTVDVKQGAVIVIAATPTATETAKFSGGVFTARGTDLTLGEKLRCGRARRLTGDGAGAFRIVGRYAAATGRGAKWTVEDTCKRSRIRVSRGVVAVRDNRRPKTVLVRSGRSYTARPKR